MTAPSPPQRPEAPRSIEEAAEAFLKAAADKGAVVTAAESCTGGLIMAALTGIAGSSAVVDRGFVTYSNTAKQQMLDVTSESLDKFGAVSAAVAKEMAFGALAHSVADLAVSVTGIAGPGGGTAEKPVGLVYVGTAVLGQTPEATEYRFGDLGREAIRLATVAEALALMQAKLSAL